MENDRFLKRKMVDKNEESTGIILPLISISRFQPKVATLLRVDLVGDIPDLRRRFVFFFTLRAFWFLGAKRGTASPLSFGNASGLPNSLSSAGFAWPSDTYAKKGAFRRELRAFSHGQAVQQAPKEAQRSPSKRERGLPLSSLKPQPGPPPPTAFCNVWSLDLRVFEDETYIRPTHFELS